MVLKGKTLAAAILIGLIAVGCSKNKQSTTSTGTVKVKTMTVQAGSEKSQKSFVGVVEEESASALSFSVQGTIERIFVSEGEVVKKGQLLAELGTENLRSSYDAAQASLKQAQDAVNRLQQLYDNKSLPEIKMVEAQTKLEQARSMAAISKKNLTNSRLIAPFSGVIGRRSVQVGENAIPGNTAFTLLDITSVKVKVSIPEGEISSFTTGKTATVGVPAIGSETFSGKIVEKGVVAHPVSHTYDVKIRLDNGGRRLMPGMVSRVWFSDGTTSSTIVLPNNLIQLSPNGEKYVWCVVQGKAKAIPVTTGGLSDSGVTIKSGLTNGAVVISEGYQKVSEGMEVSAL